MATKVTILTNPARDVRRTYAISDERATRDGSDEHETFKFSNPEDARGEIKDLLKLGWTEEPHWSASKPSGGGGKRTAADRTVEKHQAKAKQLSDLRANLRTAQEAEEKATKTEQKRTADIKRCDEEKKQAQKDIKQARKDQKKHGAEVKKLIAKIKKLGE